VKEKEKGATQRGTERACLENFFLEKFSGLVERPEFERKFGD